MTEIEKQARERVNDNPRLRRYWDNIFYDWPDWNSHMEWIATADEDEIVEWAESVGK